MLSLVIKTKPPVAGKKKKKSNPSKSYMIVWISESVIWSNESPLPGLHALLMICYIFLSVCADFCSFAVTAFHCLMHDQRHPALVS